MSYKIRTKKYDSDGIEIALSRHSGQSSSDGPEYRSDHSKLQRSRVIKEGNKRCGSRVESRTTLTYYPNPVTPKYRDAGCQSSIKVNKRERQQEIYPLIGQEIAADCYLIPRYCTDNWKYSRLVYTVAICVCLCVLATLLVLVIFWSVKTTQLEKKEKNFLVSFRGMYLLDIYGHNSFDKICFNEVDNRLQMTAGKYDCSTRQQTISRSTTMSVSGRGIFFYWLAGTRLWLTFNSTTAKPQLIEYNPSSDVSLEEKCDSVDRQYSYNEEVQFNITNDNFYYLCLSTNSGDEVKGDLEIDEMLYDLKPEDEEVLSAGCISYSNIFRELWQPTCIFITTNSSNTDSYYLSDRHHIKIEAHVRADVPGYFAAMFFILAVGTAFLTLLCLSTKYKKDHPEAKGCVCVCYSFKQHNRLLEEEQEARL